MLEQGVKYSVSVDKKAWFKRQLAYSWRMVGDFEQMVKMAEEAIVLSKELEDYLAIANSYNIIGLSVLEKDIPDFDAAVTFFNQAVSNLIRTDLKKLDLPQQELAMSTEAQVYNNLGLCLHYKKKYSDSLKAYKNSVTIKRRIGDLIGLSQTYINICLLYYEETNFKASYYWRKKALDLISELDLTFKAAYLWREIGRIMCEQGRLKVGIPTLETALHLYKQVGTSQFGISLTQEMIRDFRSNKKGD
jgi:tetratricopeptide (TPR) repeat protein